jgi:hypothetical protein
MLPDILFPFSQKQGIFSWFYKIRYYGILATANMKTKRRYPDPGGIVQLYFIHHFI